MKFYAVAVSKAVWEGRVYGCECSLHRAAIIWESDGKILATDGYMVRSVSQSDIAYVWYDYDPTPLLQEYGVEAQRDLSEGQDVEVLAWL